MAIVVNCKACQARFGVKDELVGKKIRCVKCAAVIDVSAPESPMAAAGSSAGGTRPSATPRPPATPVKPAAPGTLAAGATASPAAPASPAPVVRKARIVGRDGDSPADVPSAKVPIAASQPAASNSQVVCAARAAQPAVAVAARVVDGPRDVQKDAIRHTAATLSAPPEDYDTLRKKVFASFTADRIEPVPVKASYRIGVVLVALVMLALPVIYLAFIGLVGWGVWYHAVNHTGIISAASGVGTGRNNGRAMAMAFMVYVAPIAIGITMVIFMFKPFFSKPGKDSGRRSLKKTDEPLLFEFIECICRAVGAPQPRRIDVDCNVNASASFGNGLLSFFSSDLVLTIGMPLVAGLTMRQFGGVMAHEFGHFAQGVGMRLTYMIRSISYWFTRVVYERDSWDDKLESWSQSLDLRISWVLYLARFAVWLTRRILWVLMMLGNLVGGYLLRQMEFDADRYEARFAGSHIFPTTARQLAVLNVGFGGAMSDLVSFRDEGRLGDNLPKLILLNVDQMPARIHAKIDAESAESRTGFLDTHPCDPERTASAALENTEGIFRLRLPAAHLFRRFDWLSRAVTWDFYKEIFEDELKKEDIHPVDELVARQQKQINAVKALRRFFQGQTYWYRPISSLQDGRKTPRDIAKLQSLITSERDVMLRELVRYQKAWKEYDDADSDQLQTVIAEDLLAGKVKVRRDDFSLPMTSPAEIRQARDQIERRRADVEPRLLPFESAAERRLVAGLQLARRPELAPALTAVDASLTELDQLLDLFGMVHDQIATLLEMRDSQLTLQRLLIVFSENRESKPLFDTMQSRREHLYGVLNSLRDAFADVGYPFDHARADITLAEYLLKELPEEDNPVAVHDAADSIGNQLAPLQGRVLGRLCEIAEAVETKLGLAALNDPPEDDEDD